MRGSAVLAASLANLLVAWAQDGEGEGAADACTLAAQAVFEPCCGGEAGDATACLYPAMTYAEMCSDRACTAALNAADTVCAGETTTSQAYQYLRMALTCEGLDDPCVASVQEAMQDTCQLSAAVLADNAVQLQSVAQLSVCSSATCMSAMQTQMESCGHAEDIGTQLILQLFQSLLGTCGALAQPGTICSAAEMNEITNLCGDPGTPTCTPDCVNVVIEKVGQCPLSFTDPAMVTLASTCGTNAAATSMLPCPPGLIDELLSQSADCDAFSGAFATASRTPCADLGTNQELAQAMTTCSVATVPLAPPTDPGADGGALGVLSTLNANCPAGVNLGNFQRACCPDTAKEAWPCVRPVCGSPFDDSSCAGLGSRCPGFLTDLGAQTVMLACTQQECDPDHMQTMYSACCPASGRDAWPCDTPQCDSEECLNELTFMAQVCPLALLNDDGVTQTLQKCQQVQDAAVAAGVDDAAQQECETNNRRAISDMHRACCPQGWPCACNPAVTPCVSVDSTGLQCGQEETECLGLLNALVTTGCSSLLFDPQIQAVAAECSNRGIATAAAPPTVTGGRGAQSGRGGNGRPGNGRGGMRSGQQSIAAPAPPPTGGDDAGDGGGSIGLLVGGLLVIAVAGAAYVKTKGKSGGAVDPSDNLYTGAAPL